MQLALDAYEKVYASEPQKVLSAFATCLGNLGSMLGSLGRHEEALANTQRAVELGRKLVAARPQAFLAFLARSLNALCKHQHALGRHEEALASAIEAFDAIWPLFRARPDAFAPDAQAHALEMLQTMKKLQKNPSTEQAERIQTLQKVLAKMKG